jgi:phosphate/sulfate permease
MLSLYRVATMDHLLQQNPSLRAKQAFPIFVFVVLFINVFFFMFESPAIEDKLEPWMKAMIALGISIGLTVLATFTYRTWILKKIAEAEAGLGQSIAEAGSMEMVPSSQPIIPASQDEKKEDETAAETKEEEAKDEARLAAFQGDDLPPVYNEGGELKVSHPTDTVAEASVPLKGFTTKMESFLGRYKYTRWLVVDHHAEAFNRDQHLDKLHNKTTESYAVGVEMMFLHLLIITACFKSFSHGASDVSNTYVINLIIFFFFFFFFFFLLHCGFGLCF